MPLDNLQARLGMDSGQFVAGMSQAAQAMGGTSAGFDNLINVASKFNSKFEQVNQTIRAQLNETTQAVARFKSVTDKQLADATAAGKQIAGLIPGTNQKLTGITLKQKAPLLPENVAAGEASAEKLRQAFPAPPNATITQLSRYESSLARIQSLISNGKVSGQRFDQIFNTIKTGKGSLTDLKLNGDEQKLVGALGQISRGFQTATDSADKFNLGWRNAVRITEALLLKEAISGIVTQMQKATIEAVAFQIKISEIRTLSTENQSSFTAWSKAIAQVSDALGIPQVEVAKAAYEALSAQITEGKDQTVQFIKTAGDLARVGVADIGESGKLLASVFNAYNISVDRAEEISAKLFVGVDRGNFVVKDLAGNFGRVSSTAAAMGVRLEEVLASLTTLTRQGVSASDAQTQLLNVFLKLQNPTTTTSKFLRNIGFETGQAAVQALGFIGVLKEIEKATKGDVGALAEFGGELRAIRGLIGLTTRGKGGEFAQDLALIESKAAIEKFRNAKAIRGESAGDQLTIELNKVKNFFTNEFGQSLLETINGLTKSVGGLNAAVQTTVTVLLAGAKVLGSYFVLSKLAGGAQILFNNALNSFNTKEGLDSIKVMERNATAAKGLNAALKTIGAAVAIGFAFEEIAKFRREMDGVNKTSEDYENTLKRIKSLREGKTETGETVGHKVFTQSALDQSTEFSSFVDRLFQPLLQKEAAAAQDANKILERLREEGKETALQLAEGFKKATDAIHEVTKKYAENIRKADQSILDSKKHILSMRETVQGLIFDLKFDFADSAQKFILRDQDIQRLTNEAKDLIASTNPEDQQKGRQLAQQALQKTKEDIKERLQLQVEADKIQRQIDNQHRGAVDTSPIFVDTRPGQERLLRLEEDLKDAEEESQKRNKAVEVQQKRLLDIEEARIRLLEKRVKLFNDLKATNEEGTKVKPEFQDATGKLDTTKFKKAVDQAAKGITDLLDSQKEEAAILPELEKAKKNLLAQERANLDLQKINARQLGTGELQRGLKENFEKAAKERVAASQTTENAGVELGVAVKIVQGIVDRTRTDNKFSTIGQGENSIVEFSQRGLKLLESVTDKLGLTSDKASISERENIVQQNLPQANKIIDLQTQLELLRQKLLQRDDTGRLTAGPQDIDNLRKVSSELLLELNSFLGKFTGQLNNDNFATPGGATLKELRDQIDQALIVATKAIAGEAGAFKRQQDIANDLRNIFDPAAFAAAQQTNATVANTTGLNNLRKTLDDLVTQLKNGNFNLPQQPGASNVPVMPAGPAFGGNHHHGGLLTGPKGYDNLLIRAEAGEFVMNQESTRKWLPQLMEMNNGKSPKFPGKYHEGGLVQTNVGDVNVTISGPVSPEQNVRAIGKAIRRQIRRGDLDLSPRR